MCGVAGILARSGQLVEKRLLSTMLSALAHRGPDAAHVWASGSVGLGHCLLHTTSESFHESQPWFDSSICITADARLDNREELARILGMDLRNLPVIPDSQLIHAAYIKWGRSCPSYLLGDFAFAIWDARRQEMFCARDPFGVKPFYYTLEGGYFIFGSEIKAILCSSQVPKKLNEAWLARFLIPSSDIFDKESTFYEGIYRLTPAHSLTVTAESHSLSRFWQLDPEREVRFSREEEYYEAMREQFSRAVKVRLRSAFPVGSTLSGGLDSSSIACTARDLLKQDNTPALHTFSAVFTDSPEADESPYINAVIEQGGLQPHILYPDRTSPFIDLERVLGHLDEPFYGTNYFMPWSLYRSANENGVRVLLDGTDGDTTISHGMDYLDILARQSNWQMFALEASAVTRNFDHPRYASTQRILYSYGTPHLTDLARQGRWIAFSKGVREISQLFQVSSKRLALNWGLKPLMPRAALQVARALRGHSNGKASLQVPSHVSPEFAAHLRAQGFFQQHASAVESVQQNGHALHYHFLTLGMLPYSLEMINRMAAAYSVDVRFPFCDRNLVEFSLSIPPELKLKDGWSRYIIRKAMTRILPEKVQWRGGKISLAKVYPYMLRRYASDYVDDILINAPDGLDHYINMPAVRNMYQRFLNDNMTDELEWVWQTVVLAVWMKRSTDVIV